MLSHAQNSAKLRKIRTNQSLNDSKTLPVLTLDDEHGSFVIWHFFRLTPQQTGTETKSRT